MAKSTRFDLSRIYIKGWSAGRDSSVTDSTDGLEATIAALNPYRDGEEKERWALGFHSARSRLETRPAIKVQRTSLPPA